jgi:peptidoglycan/LPS O-acetylase OafA/YrhL
LKRLPLVDLVRSFSILCVLAIHADAFLKRPQNPALAWIWEHFQRNGTYGVYLFFLVSGFLITGVIQNNSGGLWKPSLKKFYIQRAGRILPLLLLTVWIGLLMLWIPRPLDSSYLDVFRPESGSLSPLVWVCLATFTLNWFLAFQTSVTLGMFWNLLWSLSVEEQFYFFFPPLLKLMRNEKRLSQFMAAVIGIGLGWRYLCYAAQWNNRDLQIFTSLGAFDNIAFGVLLYLAVKRWSPALSERKIWAAGIFMTGFILMAVVYAGTSLNNAQDRVYASTLLACGLFMFLLGGLQFHFWEKAGWAPFTWPGRYCYSLYLWHPLVLAFIFPIIFQMDAWKALLLFTVTTTALAAASFHFFEKPANQAIRKSLDKH